MHKTTYESSLGKLAVYFKPEGQVRLTTSTYADEKGVCASVKAGRTEVEFSMTLRPSDQHSTGWTYVDRIVYRTGERFPAIDLPESPFRILAALANEVWRWAQEKPKLFKLAEIKELERQAEHHMAKSLDFSRLAKEEWEFHGSTLHKAIALRKELWRACEHTDV